LHFDASGDAQRAWRYSVLAGEDAAAKYANVEAAEFFDRALANTKSADVPHAEITRVAEAMGDRLELLSRYTEADAAYQRARKHTTDPVGVVRLLRKQGLLRERLGRNTDALRWLGRALRAAHQGGDLAGHGENLVALALAYGGVRYRQGRYRDAIEWAQRAATDARRINDQRGLAHALDLIDLARISYPLTPSPDLPGAALTIYEEMGDLVGQSSVLTNLALAAHQAGRWDDAVALNERAREVAQQTGDVGSVAVAMCNLGEVLCDQGRCDEARDVLSQARRAAVAARYEILIAGTTLYLGRTEARAGNAEKALSLIDDALLMSQSMGAATVMLDAQIRRAECLLALGRAQTALTVTESALTGIEHSDQDPNLRSAFFRVRGKSLLALHDVEGARAAIEQAIGLARTAGAPGELAESLLAQADVDDACGTPASTLRAEAFRIYRNLGVVDRVP
jgi:tetratricopeptide (TPR) repeat protein